jgi:glycosyltransferase involved in cell wall biosynthesis
MAGTDGSENGKRIYMVLYKYFINDTRVRREAEALTKAGYKVTVINLFDEAERGTEIPGVRTIETNKISFSDREGIRALFKFWISSFLVLLKERKHVDILHAHDLTSLPPAALFKLISPRCKLIYDSHELFPEAAWDKLSFVHYLLFLMIELVCSTQVDFIIGASKNQILVLSSRIARPYIVLLNVPDLYRIENKVGPIPLKKKSTGKKSVYRIVYSGAVLEFRGYDVLVEAAGILNSGVHNERFEFWIVGDGPLVPSLKESIAGKGLEAAFIFTGSVSFETLLKKVASCDIAIALYEETRNNMIMISNKIFEYMVVGIPIIFTKLEATQPILEKVNAVIISLPVCGENVAEAIMNLVNDAPRRALIEEQGPKLVKDLYNWQSESRKLISAYANF